MKKIIVVGLLLMIALFSYTSKRQPKKQRDIPNKYEVNEKQLMINRNNHDEPIEITKDISEKQRPVNHFLGQRKGKVNYPKNHTTVLE
ncbi:hypothetical protein [Flavobacterium sp. LB2P6]|uniref:hypothetical protein n=1 Tax=Flavobacterium sp. LB2P6 TaxID=3401714 RepID=UPI003AAD3B1E